MIGWVVLRNNMIMSKKKIHQIKINNLNDLTDGQKSELLKSLKTIFINDKEKT